MTQIAYDMFDLKRDAEAAKRFARCERIYHRGQEMAWDGKDILPMLLEKVGESFDAVLDPVLARATIAKGRKLVLKLGDKEIDLMVAKDEETGMPKGDPLFKLYLQTKLPNPHYIPEIQV